MKHLIISGICLAITACGSDSGGADSNQPQLTEISPIGISNTHMPEYAFNALEDGTLSYSGACSSNTTQASIGPNTISFNYLANGSYHDCQITLTDNADKISDVLNVTPFEVNADTTPPVISQNTPLITTTYDRTPSFEFTSTEAGTISYAGDCTSNTTIATSGSNVVTFNLLTPSTHDNCQIIVTDYERNQSNTLNLGTFEIQINPSPGTINVTAWVNNTDSLISFSENAEGFYFYRSTDKNCDIYDFINCINAELDTFTGNPITDHTLTTNRESYYTLDSSGSGNFSKTAMISTEFFPPRERPSMLVYNNQLWIIGGSGDNAARNDVWSSPDGRSWIQKANNVEFPTEMIPKTVVFNNKLWVIGGSGYNVNGNSNGIWSSTDGKNWAQDIAHAAFSARGGHQVVAFNNKLWLIGGDGYSNDIWSSTDGVTWILEKDHADFSARVNHKVVVWNNKMWLIGGHGSSSNYFSDVWSSTDGINWVEATASTPYPEDSGVSDIVVYNNMLWRIGGGKFTSQDKEIWYSADGATWTLATASPAFDKRYEHQVAVFDGKMWLTGGFSTSSESPPWHNDIWTSTNGTDWTQVETIESKSYKIRYSHQSVEFNNKLFIIGGITGFSNSPSNDIWSSIDGISWNKDVAHASFGSAYRHKVIKFNNKLWLIGGLISYYRSNDIWSSVDGINWTLATNYPGFANRSDHAVLVFNNKLWVIAGSTGSLGASEYTNEVWSSSDGISWTQATNSAAFTTRANLQAVVFNNKMWVIGGKADYTYRNDIWSSTDGINWVCEKLPFSLLERLDFQAAVFNDKIWIIGGNTGTYPDPIYKNDIWSSTDGKTWNLVLDSAPFQPRGAHSTAIFDNKLWIIGGDSLAGALHDAWATEDGIIWRRGIKGQIEYP